MTAIMPKDEVQKLLDEKPRDAADLEPEMAILKAEVAAMPRNIRHIGVALLELTDAFIKHDARIITQQHDLARSLIAAHDEMERLRAEVERVQSDRQYVIGANDGWDATVEQGEASPAVGKAMVRFWKKLAETHNTRADNLATDNARLAAQVEALTGALQGIAKQKTTDEISATEDIGMCDFEEGYDSIIGVAHTALDAATLAATAPAEQAHYHAMMGQRRRLKPNPDGTIPARTVIEAPEDYDWNARFDAAWPPNEASGPCEGE